MPISFSHYAETSGGAITSSVFADGYTVEPQDGTYPIEPGAR